MGEGEEWNGFERTIVMWIDTKGSPSLESLHLLRMMTNNDWIKFKWRWICECFMWEVKTNVNVMHVNVNSNIYGV